MRASWTLLQMARPLWKGIVLSWLLAALTILAGIGLMSTSGYLISLASLHGSFAGLQVPAVGVRFFGISRGVFRYLERWFGHSTTFRILAEYRSWYYSRLEPLAPVGLSGMGAGDLVSQAAEDVDSLQHWLVRVLAPVAVVPLVGAAMVAFLWHAGLLVVVAFLVPFLMVALAALSSVPFQVGLAEAQLQERSRLSGLVLDMVEGGEELRIAGAEQAWLEKARQVSGKALALQQRAAMVLSLVDGMASLCSVAAAVLVAWTAGAVVGMGLVPAVMVASFVLGTLAAFEVVLPLGSAAQHAVGVLAAAKRLQAVADQPLPVQDADCRNPAAAAMVPKTGRMDANGLQFAYPGRPATALSLDFHVEPGEFVGLIGASGSGKTTLLRILARFVEFQGSLEVGGVSWHSVKGDSARKALSVAPQRAVLFTGSVRDNLALGISASAQDLEKVLDAVGLRERISTLEQGLETEIGPGGQWQPSGGEQARLCLARALLRRAQVLFLDEPFASLDAANEQRIVERLADLPGRPTILLVSHRPQVLLRCDRILVLENGKIVESGFPRELASMNSCFARWLASANPLP